MNITDAYYGSHTNAITLTKVFQNTEKGGYLDFCSLYPIVLKYEKYPVGHPMRIITNFKNPKCVPCNVSPCPINACMGEHWDLDYFGLIKVKILPPRGLIFPVLHIKINSKLLFPLCQNCAHKEENILCSCTEEECALTGTWCMPEVNTAINMGCEILCMYSVTLGRK